jgi:hypothetical protein
VKWGKEWEPSKNNLDEWEKCLQEKEFSFPDILNPASWNDVELIISPASPEQLGYFKLSMDTDNISLNQSWK